MPASYNPHNRHGPPKNSTKLSLQEEEDILRLMNVPVPQRHRWKENSSESQYSIENGHIIRLRLILPEENSVLSPKLKFLTYLEELDLSYNDIAEIPSEIGQLFRLKKLNFSNTSITILPKEIGNLTQLQILDLQHTNISEFPNTIGKLSELQELNLNDCPISKIPSEFTALYSLRILKLNNTLIDSIPSEIQEMKSLEIIEFAGKVIDLKYKLK